MSYNIDIRTGFTVSLEGVGMIKGPQSGLIISDELFASLSPFSFHASDAAYPLKNNGYVTPGTEDAVVTQAAVVAAPSAMTATTTAAANAATQSGSYVQVDVQTIATLANELKGDFNALHADVTALRTTVAGILTSIKGAGKPMASA